MSRTAHIKLNKKMAYQTITIKNMNENISNKSLTTTILLALFLGIWGAHRFYAGKTGSAIAMLLLSLSMVGLMITSIWAFVDMIIIIMGNFKDKEGMLIKN